MNKNFFDVSDAEPQSEFTLIPHNTVAKVRITLKPGFYNNSELGLKCGNATQGESGAVFFKTEYEVISGKYKKSRVFGIIGIYSPKVDPKVGTGNVKN